jgi:hypothetical protein
MNQFSELPAVSGTFASALILFFPALTWIETIMADAFTFNAFIISPRMCGADAFSAKPPRIAVMGNPESTESADFITSAKDNVSPGKTIKERIERQGGTSFACNKSPNFILAKWKASMDMRVPMNDRSID